MRFNDYIKYQLVETFDQNNGATSKARTDAFEVLKKNGFKAIFFKIYNGSNVFLKVFNRINYFFSFTLKLLFIKRKSLVLIQIPFVYYPNFSSRVLLFYRRLKKISIISLIHDVDELRFSHTNRNTKCFHKILNRSDYIISHNEMMTKYISKIALVNKIYNLQIFDYLCENENIEKKFIKKIVIAGNLSPEKTGYIYMLNKLNKVKFELYGPGFKEYNSANVIYKGVFGANQLHSFFDGGFGLIWDGESINSCDGPFGKYLQYNNPHKISLYLSSGLPVIIWAKAALAEFVEKNHLGFAVNDLYEAEEIVNNCTEDNYLALINSVKIMQKKISHGYFLKNAIEKIKGDIEK